MTLKNGYPGLFQAPIARNRHYTTGLFNGFLGVFFSDIPVLGFIGNSGDFAQGKTGLFGAVWIED
jgi:hypothetical protein